MFPYFTILPLFLFRYPDVALKYRILDTALSKQLPSMILFKEGKEEIRRPQADTKNNLIKYAILLILFLNDHIQIHIYLFRFYVCILL